MREPLRVFSLVGGLGLTLGGLTVGGALLGLYLDRHFHSGPWLTLVGTLGGMTAGFFEMITMLRRIGGNDRGER